MIDDHNRWVNVSSGTGSPGLSGQNPDSHKTVVVAVAVCGEKAYENHAVHQKFSHLFKI